MRTRLDNAELHACVVEALGLGVSVLIIDKVDHVGHVGAGPLPLGRCAACCGCCGRLVVSIRVCEFVRGALFEIYMYIYLLVDDFVVDDLVDDSLLVNGLLVDGLMGEWDNLYRVRALSHGNE